METLKEAILRLEPKIDLLHDCLGFGRFAETTGHPTVTSSAKPETTSDSTASSASPQTQRSHGLKRFSRNSYASIGTNSSANFTPGAFRQERSAFRHQIPRRRKQHALATSID